MKLACCESRVPPWISLFWMLHVGLIQMQICRVWGQLVLEEQLHHARDNVERSNLCWPGAASLAP